MTYIGQAQIETPSWEAQYEIGDTVAWRSQPDNPAYIVMGFEGDRVILRPLGEPTWRPPKAWFVKA